MSYIAKVAAVGTLSAGAIGGVSYAGYHQLTKVSFANKLGVSVLNLTGTDNSTIWTKRWEELKLIENGLDNELTATKTTKWQDLQKWCNDNKDNRFSEDKDTKYKHFEKFCTWKVEDKLEGHIATTIGKDQVAWKTAHTKLKAKPKSELSTDLQTIYELTDETQQKTKMHDWCTNAYKNTWTGEKDPIFAISKDICKST